MEDPLYQHTYYATHPDMMDGATNEELRDRYRVPGLFEPGKITLVYSHGERFVVGGAVPGAAPLALPTQVEPENVAGRPLLERRELAVVNIGAGRGTILVDGQQVELDKYDALYVPMGSKDVQFAGEGARFYLLSVPAHVALPMRKMRAADVVPMERGSAEQSNRRTIYQLILPHTCQSASLCLGLTKLDSGSVWNTMPPHVHERRSEIYLYFDLEEDNRVFHYMGKPDALRHIVLENEEVVLSPPWSVHMGSGTSNYSFIWAMAGENLDYNDMDVIDICQLR